MGLPPISIRGARVHNLRSVDCDIPRGRLVVITGPSGSGKSSLAFDTLFAEGQRRYVESLSAYARQFLDQMEKPDVDSVTGLSPAIAIEQRTTASHPRSTVGTVTEIYDHLRLLFAAIGRPHCPRCGDPVCAQTADEIAQRIQADSAGSAVSVLAPVVRGRKGGFRKELAALAAEGFRRARVDGEAYDLEEQPPLDPRRKHHVEVLVDRLALRPGSERRLRASVERALRLAGGVVHVTAGETGRLFSERFACSRCGTSIVELSPRLFSFNSRVGACPECEGLGWRWECDAPAPGPAGDAPSGEPAALGVPEARARAERLLRLFETLEGGAPLRSEAFDELQPFLRQTTCAACHGARLRPEALAVRLFGLSIADVTHLAVRDLAAALAASEIAERERPVVDRLRPQILDRARVLEEVGLGYLTLDRSTTTLSAGEAHRVRLAGQIGARMQGVLYILDEPSVGLHPRDNERLLTTLETIRDAGNTVVVVEHDLDTIRRADYIVDLGEGAGLRGGRLMYEGPPSGLDGSLTGRYVRGELKVPVPTRRRPGQGALVVRGARAHNLRGIDVRFPLGALTVVTGVSGAGKSTLVDEILHRAVTRALSGTGPEPGRHAAVDGVEGVDAVVAIDQRPIGRSPRSNPATYTGVLAAIRDVFSVLPEARARGYKPGRFSFNIKGGRCESCQGEGVRALRMHFLPDAHLRCEACRGRRYNRETLEILYRGRSIADVLDLTVSEARTVLGAHPRLARLLAALDEVGLGYIHLGQSAATLSGGEAQRVKLARELGRRDTGHTLYILDEPTTGLHMEDVARLLEVLSRLVEGGNTVVLVEHNLEVIKTADHVVDLGPEGGSGGGRLVAAGTPEQVARSRRSHTGRALRPLLVPALEGDTEGAA